MRTHDPELPILLIGTKNDLINKVSEDQISQLMEESHLQGFFKASVNQNDVQSPIFKRLLEEIICEPMEGDLSLKLNPPDISLNDENFKEFLKAFSNCPICHRRNHFQDLRAFYFSESEGARHLLTQLMNLYSKSLTFGETYYNDISIGIPCCACFNKYFKLNENFVFG